MRRLSIGKAALTTVVGLVVVLLTAPTLIVIIASFGETEALTFPPKGFSTRWYENFFTTDWLSTAMTSVRIASLAALLATVLGTMAAFSIIRGRYRGKSLVQAFFLAPLIVPTVVFGIGAFQVFNRWHITGTSLSLILAHAAIALPFVVITVGASLQTVDPVFERAAANLGAGPATTFVRITLPLILPGMLAGALFAFVTSLDEVAVALFLTSPTVTTLPVEIYTTLQNSLDPTVAAISALLLAVTLVVIIAPAVLRRKREVPPVEEGASA